MTLEFEVVIAMPSGKTATHRYARNREAAKAVAVFRRHGHDARAYAVARTPVDVMETDGVLVLGPLGCEPPSSEAVDRIDDTACLTDEDRKAIDGLGGDLIDKLSEQRKGAAS